MGNAHVIVSDARQPRGRVRLPLGCFASLAMTMDDRVRLNGGI
jgi:hypothetical protein